MISVLGGATVLAALAAYGSEVYVSDRRASRGLKTTDNYAAAAKKVAVPYEVQAT